MTVKDPQPLTGTLLKITGATTYTFSVGDGELGDETFELERELDRPAFGGADTWFELGDLQFNPSKLNLTVTLTRPTLSAAKNELNLLMAAATTATKVAFGGLERAVFGIGKPFVMQRVPLGYRCELTFLPKSPTWTNVATGQEEWA